MLYTTFSQPFICVGHSISPFTIVKCKNWFENLTIFLGVEIHL